MKTSIITFLILSLIFLSPDFCEAKNSKHHKHHKHHKNAAVVVHQRTPRHTVVVRENVSPLDNGAPITSRRCPFSCATEGIAKSHCRDWRNGNTCYVQNTLDGSARLSWPRSFSTGYYPNYPSQASQQPYRNQAYQEPLPSVGEVLGRKIDQAIGR